MVARIGIGSLHIFTYMELLLKNWNLISLNYRKNKKFSIFLHTRKFHTFYVHTLHLINSKFSLRPDTSLFFKAKSKLKIFVTMILISRYTYLFRVQKFHIPIKITYFPMPFKVLRKICQIMCPKPDSHV